MYEYIKGVFTGMNKDCIVVENNGIGYKIYTSGSTIAQIPQLNEEVSLFIQQIVREDFIGLYGFLTKDELNMFNLLLTINGVGAKAALSLLSICSVINLKYAIISKDEKTLVRAPGIGKKIAQRINLELMDKIDIDKNISLNNEGGNEGTRIASNEAQARFYWELAFVAIGFMPALFYHFVLSFCNRSQRTLLILSYLYAVFFSIVLSLGLATHSFSMLMSNSIYFINANLVFSLMILINGFLISIK